MEKIRSLVLPDEFASLKVAKSTLEFIRLEGDLRDRCRLPRVLARLDSQRLNLAGFPNVLKVTIAKRSFHWCYTPKPYSVNNRVLLLSL